MLRTTSSTALPCVGSLRALCLHLGTLLAPLPPLLPRSRWTHDHAPPLPPPPSQQDVAMAKSKNHTCNNQTRVNHRNGASEGSVAAARRWLPRPPPCAWLCERSPLSSLTRSPFARRYQEAQAPAVPVAEGRRPQVPPEPALRDEGHPHADGWRRGGINSGSRRRRSDGGAGERACACCSHEEVVSTRRVQRVVFVVGVGVGGGVQ